MVAEPDSKSGALKKRVGPSPTVPTIFLVLIMLSPQPGQLWRFAYSTNRLVLIVSVNEKVIKYIRLSNGIFSDIDKDDEDTEIHKTTFNQFHRYAIKEN